MVSDDTVPVEEGAVSTMHDLNNDTYINMEIALPQGDAETPQLARVTKRAKDNDGKPVGTAHTNPLLDSREYEVTFSDGSIEIMRANVIAENLFAQVDEQGHRHQLLDEIVDHRKEKDVLEGDDAFTIDKRNGKKHLKKSYRGWSSYASAVERRVDELGRAKRSC